MGNRHTIYLDEKNDLYNTPTIEEHVILLTISPVLVVDGDIETKLTTGSNQLDDLLYKRLSHHENIISKLITNNLKYNLLYADTTDGKVYVSLEKIDKTLITLDDCQTIRKFFYDYTLSQTNPIIIKDAEAIDSLFYDDLGHIRLGSLITDPIEFI